MPLLVPAARSAVVAPLLKWYCSPPPAAVAQGQGQCSAVPSPARGILRPVGWCAHMSWPLPPAPPDSLESSGPAAQMRGKAGLAAAALSSWTWMVPCITPPPAAASAPDTGSLPGGCTASGERAARK